MDRDVSSTPRQKTFADCLADRARYVADGGVRASGAARGRGHHHVAYAPVAESISSATAAARPKRNTWRQSSPGVFSLIVLPGLVWPCPSIPRALTAIANDYGFEHIFARQLEGLVRPGDVACGITTSGESPNVVAGLRTARAKGATTIVFSGNGGGAAAREADVALTGTVRAIVESARSALGAGPHHLRTGGDCARGLVKGGEPFSSTAMERSTSTQDTSLLQMTCDSSRVQPTVQESSQLPDTRL